MSNGVVSAIERGMEIKEVDNNRLNGIDHCVAMKLVSRQSKTTADIIEVESAHLLHFRRKVHNRIVKQGQSSTRTIVAMRCAYRDELRSSIKYINLKVAALPYVFQQFAATYYQAVATPHDIPLAIERETAFPFMAIGMAQVSVFSAVTDIHQRIFKNHILHIYKIMCLHSGAKKLQSIDKFFCYN